jgi:hypothetical protein
VGGTNVAQEGREKKGRVREGGGGLPGDKRQAGREVVRRVKASQVRSSQGKSSPVESVLSSRLLLSAASILQVLTSI